MFSSQGSSSPQWPYTDSHHPLDSSNIPPYPVPFRFGEVSSAGQHTSSSQLGYASTHYEQQSLSHPPPSSFLMETPAQPSDIHLPPSSRLSYMRGGPPHDDDPDVSRKRRASDEPACSGPTNRQRQESPPPISLSTARLLPPALTNTTQAELVDVRAATPTTHSSTTVDRRTDGSRPLSLPPPTSTASHPPNRSSGGPRQTTAATDLWYFVFGTSDKDKPADRATISRTERFSVKPSTTKYSHLGCRACLDDGKHTIWKNANGCNKHIRKHLTKYHAEEYRAQTEEHNLKKIYTVVSSSPERVVRNTTDNLSKDLSMKAGFERRLAEWLAVDKQAIHNFECPEFQRLLMYLAQGRLADEDIPSPTKLEKIMIFQSFDNLVQDLAASLGDISFTYDTWTYPGRGGFVALTAHWCAESPYGDLVIRSELAALQYIRKYDDMQDVLKERLENLGRLGITKIGKITSECDLDNGELDGPHMSLFKCDIVDAVINLAFDNFYIKEPPLHCYELIKACQSVSQDKSIQQLAMERPSHYSFLDRLYLAGPFLDMRTAISDLAKNYPDVEKYQLSDASWSLLCEFRAFFDLIREALSSLIFLDYVLLPHFPRKLRAMKGILYISPVIEEAASLLEDMMRKWKTNWKRDDTYLIAMIINPTIKFSEFATKDGCSRNQIRRHFVNLMSSKHRRSRHAVDCRKPAGQSVASMNEDKEVAKAELARYLKAGLHERTPDFNLLTFWKDFKEEYPLIYAIALDYMPIQACAVSCRRLFLSSEHTDSLRKRQISFQHFEALERQRFSSGKARLHDIAWSHLDAFQYFVEDYYPADDFFDDNGTTPGKHVEHKSDDDEDDDESDKDEEDEEDD